MAMMDFKAKMEDFSRRHEEYMERSARQHKEIMTLLREIAVSRGCDVSDWPSSAGVEGFDGTQSDNGCETKVVVKLTSAAMPPPKVSTSRVTDLGMDEDQLNSKEEADVDSNFQRYRTTTDAHLDSIDQTSVGLTEAFKKSEEADQQHSELLALLGNQQYNKQLVSWSGPTQPQLTSTAPVGPFTHARKTFIQPEVPVAKNPRERKIWDPGIMFDTILKQHLEDKVFLGAGVMIWICWNDMQQ